MFDAMPVVERCGLKEVAHVRLVSRLIAVVTYLRSATRRVVAILTTYVAEAGGALPNMGEVLPFPRLLGPVERMSTPGEGGASFEVNSSKFTGLLVLTPRVDSNLISAEMTSDHGL